MIKLNTDITDDFVDDNWRQLRDKVDQETKAIVANEFAKLKQDMDEILENYQQGNYDEALRNELTKLETDTRASIKGFAEQQAQVQQALSDLTASLEEIDDADVQAALAELQSATQQTQQRLTEVRKKVLSFSNTAGKTIASTIMKSITGGVG